MPIGMSCSVRGSSAALPAARAREAAIAERSPPIDRLDQLGQGPDRGDADGAGADEAHLVAPGGVRRSHGAHRRRASRRERREVRHAPAPADQRADQHRDADPQADQVADAEQREGQEEIEAGHAAALAADAEIPHHIAGEHARGHDDREHRRNDRAPQHARQAGAALLDCRGLCVRRRRRPSAPRRRPRLPDTAGRNG